MSETETHAFCLKMAPGMAEEYERRHDEIWPEMKQMLLDSGIIEYEIYLEKETSLLFGHIVRRKDHTMANTAANPVNQRWQQMMKDILVQENGANFRRELKRVFLLKAD